MNKIIVIIKKEWAEIFKNRMVLFTTAFLPLIFIVIPLGVLLALRHETSLKNSIGNIPDQYNLVCPPDIGNGECMQVYLVSQFMVLFMILPLAIPATISAYSIVGEKTTHSLEPLLATPITTTQLLMAKGLAAAIPAILATYAAYGIYALGAWIIIENNQIYHAIMDVRWILAVLFVGPLMSMLAVSFSIIVSSRVNDPRVAEQISMVVIVPVIALFVGQMTGLFVINRQIIFVAAFLLVMFDIVMVYLAVQLFQRETILTRWK
jgi:ABC-2 type transport system permease protein